MNLTKEEANVILVLLRRVNNIGFEETEAVAILRKKLMGLAGNFAGNEPEVSQEKKSAKKEEPS